MQYRHARFVAARVRFLLLSGVSVVLLASCKDESVATAQVAASFSDIESIEISNPQGDIFEMGSTVKLTATVRDHDGKVVTTAPLDWSVSRPDVIELEENQLTVNGALNDSIYVTASYGYSFGRFRFFAWPSVPQDAPVRVSGETEQSRWYVVRTDEKTEKLEVTLSGGTGDPDLYMWEPGTWEGARMICESFTPTTSERCVINNPKPGLWSIEVFAHSRAMRDVELRAVVTSR